VLTPGTVYVFSLRAKDLSGSSMATINIFGNSAPQSGYLCCDPCSGNALQTLFEVRAADRTDDISDFPLKYRFGYKIASSSSVELALTSTFTETRYVSNFFLPPGYISVVAYICDNMGATTRAVNDIDGNPLLLIVNQTIIDNLSQFGGDLLNNAKIGGDIAQLSQVVNVLLQMIPTSKADCNTLGCGPNGVCLQGKCVCNSNKYSGTFCEVYVIINGGYSAWGGWSECSVSCGVGTRSRSRKCNNPVPENGGIGCDVLGPETDYQQCLSPPCTTVVDGGYSEWSDWSVCDSKCPDSG
jgi:hypothetical protein